MGTNAAELEIYVKLGMKPMDAILTATRNAAEAIKLGQGPRHASRRASSPTSSRSNGDPLADIACLQEKKNIQLVMKEGTRLRRPPPGEEQERRQRQAGRVEDRRLSVAKCPMQQAIVSGTTRTPPRAALRVDGTRSIRAYRVSASESIRQARATVSQDFLRRGEAPATASPQRERKVVTNACSLAASTASGASASATESAMW